MNALALTRGLVHNVILVPGYIKATPCKKKQDIKNILRGSEKVGGI